MAPGSERVQVLGLCRFSYPAELNGFQTRHETMDERRAFLYAPRRLKERLFLFEHLLLPGIRSQTNGDFTLLLLIGEDLPENFRERLLALVEGIPQIKPVCRKTGPHRQVYRDLLLEARDPNADVVAEFRLDDDDAVALNYVQSLRRTLPSLRPLFSKSDRLAFDQGKGVVVQADETGVSYFPLIAHCWSAALTVFFRPDDPRCVMDFPHQRVWQRMPTFSASDQLMFLRGSHATNDSRIVTGGTAPVDIAGQELRGRISKRFAVDTRKFETGWAHLIHSH